MYEPLAPCPSCHRHVRASAGACPFCQTQIHVARVIPSPTTRLARGALFVFASSVAACGGSTAPDTAGDSASSDTSSKTDSVGVDSMGIDSSMTDTGNVAPPYGIPPEDTGAVDDTGTPGAKYGAPPPPDGG
jgi:hypothetical protein